MLSPLCAQALNATLYTGRNILCTGAWAPCQLLISALLHEGARPAWLGEDERTAPAGTVAVASAAEAQRLGADRVGVSGLSAAVTVAALGCWQGAVAYLPGGRLDRVLMRYVLAGGAPMQVLAGVDIVLTVGPRPGAAALTEAAAPVLPPLMVLQVVALQLSDAGYVPQLLFASDVPPVQGSLVPLMPPSFVEEWLPYGFAGAAGTLAAAQRAQRPRLVIAAAAVASSAHSFSDLSFK